jgi:WD40 repeat protein
VWDVTTGKQLRKLEGRTFWVRKVVWSPDGKWLASCSDDRTVRVWDATSGKQLRRLEGHTHPVREMEWSPDGKWLASCSDDRTVRVWDATTGQELYTLEGHTNVIYNVRWSPDGKRLASFSRNFAGAEAEVRIWRTNTWNLLAAISDLSSLSNLVVWHPHLSLLVTAGQRPQDLFVWQLDVEHLLHEASSTGTVHYRNAKVVLVGDSGVGKSGLALVLTGHRFTPTDSTHGRHVWLLDQQEVSLDSRLHETREIWLWDLAGQPDYRLIHQLHLHEATIALIVFDPASSTDPFAGIRHWHRALRLAKQVGRSETLPLTIFLIAARMDRGANSVSRARIDNLVHELGCAGYLETSAKEGRGITELGQAIRTALDWATLPTVTSTKLLQAIKTFVRNEQGKGQPLYTASELYRAFPYAPDALASRHELQQQFETALNRLAALGDIRSFGFGNLVLLQPERLDAYASALVIAVRDEPDGLGYIPEERVRQGQFTIPQEERLSDRVQEQLLLIAMIEELVRHELALREGGFLLFPSQSTHEHPELAMLADKQTVTFTFAGPILSIYTKLVVRLAQSGIFQKQDLWQDVVTYTTRLGGTYGLLLSPQGEERAELGLFFDESTHEEMCFYFEDFVHAHLERHAGRMVQRRRRFVCPKCGKVFPDTDVTYRQSHGFTFIKCICDTDVSLLDGEKRLATSSTLRVREMEQTANTQRDRESAATIQQGNDIIQERNKQKLPTTGKSTSNINIYISSAATLKDQTLLGELERQMAMLKRQPDIHVWDKRLLVAGTNRQKEITTHINQAHLILLLFSPDFLASDECYDEMELAIKRADKGETHLIPILMRPTANWQNTPIGQLQPLPADQKPVSDRADREKALGDIAEHIGKVIAQIRHDLSNSHDGSLRNATQGGAANKILSDRKDAASLLQNKIATQDFDIFLCYNRKDRPEVKQIGEQLKLHGILPWLDEWELRPGMPWQRALEKQIDQIKSVAVFVGNDGIGPWQQMEVEAFLREFVSRGCPVIPVLLKSAPQKPALPLFLRGMTWVDFRVENPEPMQRLLWGITDDANYGA